MMTEASLGIAAIFFIILFYVALSALGAVILWGCARGIGKIENATYLNSWGLFWILTAAQFVVSLLMFGLVYTSAIDDPFWWFRVMNNGGFMVLWFIFYAICIFIALIITKAFWKCTFKQSVLTHMIPVIVYTLITIFYIMFTYSMIGNGMYY